ncbi:MAG TPA: adenylyl-sulfate kinase [bacterium]
MSKDKNLPAVDNMSKALSGLRIVIVGKGGSGKSSILALMHLVLKERGYEIHILDGDASNSGLYRLLGFQRQPAPLVDYFGGVTFAGEPGKVTCPVDDPTPLDKEKMALSKIPKEYFEKADGVTMFAVGKITNAYEGCHGPQSKVTRDFVLPGNHVTLIDIEAGLEHFGRGIEVNADAVLTVVDPNVTSVETARYVVKMVREMQNNPLKLVGVTDKLRLKKVWTILNKVDSTKTEILMQQKLLESGIQAIGTVRYDHAVARLSLLGEPLKSIPAMGDVAKIVDYLEKVGFRDD